MTLLRHILWGVDSKLEWNGERRRGGGYNSNYKKRGEWITYEKESLYRCGSSWWGLKVEAVIHVSQPQKVEVEEETEIDDL